MLKQIAVFSFTIFFSVVGCLNLATAQDTLAVGQVEYSDESDVIIVGQSDAVRNESSVSLVEFADDLGSIDYGLIEIEQDGAFILLAPAYVVQNSASVFIGLMVEGRTNDTLMVFLAENLKILPNSEVRKFNAHDFKEAHVEDISKFDIYWDTREPDKLKRKLVLIKKSDTSIKVDTGDTLEDAIRDFPNDDNSTELTNGN